MTTRYQPWMCYRCGHVSDAASHLRDDKAIPRVGDLSACIGCGAPHRLRKDGKWTQASTNELARLKPEERRELTMNQWAIGRMLQTLGRPGGKQGGRA